MQGWNNMHPSTLPPFLLPHFCWKNFHHSSKSLQDVTIPLGIYLFSLMNSLSFYLTELLENFVRAHILEQWKKSCMLDWRPYWPSRTLPVVTIFSIVPQPPGPNQAFRPLLCLNKLLQSNLLKEGFIGSSHSQSHGSLQCFSINFCSCNDQVSLHWSSFERWN